MTMVLAFVLKAVIPAGFMPETKNGFMELVICSGMGEKTILVPNGETPSSEHQDDKAGKDVCAYQILASGKILVPDVTAIQSAPVREEAHSAQTDDSRLLSAHHLSFEARGPPSA